MDKNTKDCPRLLKIVQICQKMSNIFKKNQNCQKLSNLSKFSKNCQKLSKTVKNCQQLSKIVKIVKKNCQNVGQVMFPHHSDQMSQRSQVSGVTLWCQK